MNQAYQEKIVGVVKALDTVALVYGLSLEDDGKILAIELSPDNVEAERRETR